MNFKRSPKERRQLAKSALIMLKEIQEKLDESGIKMCWDECIAVDDWLYNVYEIDDLDQMKEDDEIDEVVITSEQTKNLIEHSKERNIKIREASDMLDKGNLTADQYIEVLAKQIGKEKFWDLYNECLADYFRGLPFSDEIILNKIKECDHENAI